MEAKVLSRALSPKHGNILLSLLSEEGKEDLELTPEEDASFGHLSAGDRVYDEELLLLRDIGGKQRALAAALRILSTADNSFAQLKRKLEQRGYGAHAVVYALGEVAQRGYVREDDQVYRYAVQLANRKLWGPRRILLELKRRGYADAMIRAALAEAEEAGEIDFRAVKARLLQTARQKGLSPDAQKKLCFQNGFSVSL